MRRSLAFLFLALVGGCGDLRENLRAREVYQALGHEPGWTLIVDDARLKFATSTPKTLIELPTPLAAISPYGRRYVRDRIAVEIAHTVCNDSHSGIAFEDTVTVLVDGYAYRGCGGPRAPLLDR